jgi:hypothetical protein
MGFHSLPLHFPPCTDDPFLRLPSIELIAPTLEFDLALRLEPFEGEFFAKTMLVLVGVRPQPGHLLFLEA